MGLKKPHLELRVRAQLREEVVAKFASLYRDNPTCQSCRAISKQVNETNHCSSPEGLDCRQSKTAKRRKKQSLMEAELHYSTFGISSDAVTQFCIVLGALVHDVDHTGLPNSTLVKEQSALAIGYEHKSVTEQHSIKLALLLLDDDAFVDLQACKYLQDERTKDYVSPAPHHIVLAMDIIDKELQELRTKNRWDKAFDNDSVDEIVGSRRLSGGDGNEPEVINRKATIVIEHIIQTSDVAHTNYATLAHLL
jgi:hypothetical protein